MSKTYYRSKALNDVLAVAELSDFPGNFMQRYKATSLRTHVEFTMSGMEWNECCDEVIAEEDLGLKLLGMLDDGDAMLDLLAQYAKRIAYNVENDKWDGAIKGTFKVHNLIDIPTNAFEKVYKSYVTPEHKEKILAHMEALRVERLAQQQGKHEENLNDCK